MAKIKASDVFKVLESNLTGKRIGHDKLQRKEGCVPVLNSPNFVDPYDKIQKAKNETPKTTTK